MVQHCRKILPKDEAVRLLSGASAWSDHVAVMLFLDPRTLPISGLELHLPCAWDPQARQFVESNGEHWARNPGGLLNRLHRQMSAKRGKILSESIFPTSLESASLTTNYLLIVYHYTLYETKPTLWMSE